MPFFDKKGNMIDADKVNLDGDFPKLEDLDELPKIKGKKLFSLMGKVSSTSMVLASVVVALLIVVVVLALKINSLSKEVTPLSKENKQLETPQTNKEVMPLSKENKQIEIPQTKYDKLEARVRKLEGAAKIKPRPVAASKK